MSKMLEDYVNAPVNTAAAWTDLYVDENPVQAAWDEIPEGDWSWDQDMPVIQAPKGA